MKSIGKVVCPYCKHSHGRYGFDIDGGEKLCDECGETFDYSGEARVIWKTSKLKRLRKNGQKSN